jgi:hypothetical protein
MRQHVKRAARALAISGILVGGGTAIAHAATASPSAKAVPVSSGSRAYMVALQCFSWRWRDSNPRPWATDWDFSGRSQVGSLTSRLPPAEDLEASPGSMFGCDPQAEPLP